MLPRVSRVKYNNKIYKIVSSLWKFQSFAHKGDKLEIFGNVDDKNNIIILDNEKYYIKYIHKSTKII